MHIFNKVKQDIIQILQYLSTEHNWPKQLNFDLITSEPPRETNHGDISTNAAMIFSKAIGLKPTILAELIIAQVKNLEYVTNVELAGPGFINITLKNEVWQQVVNEILLTKINYGDSNIGNKAKVNLEYVSVNPTGPMHVGHVRGAVIGDCLAALLTKCNYSVTKEYYFNDAGSQIDILCRSAYLRYLEACGQEIHIPSGLYPGSYLIPVGEQLKAIYGDKLINKAESEWMESIRSFTVDAMMNLIKQDLLQLGIKHDVFVSEQSLHINHEIDKAYDVLLKQGLIYQGTLPPPKNNNSQEDWEERPQTLFRSSNYGDDQDRALKKSNNSWTYFAAELAYIANKLARGYTHLIIILGSDHSGYVKRVQAATKALSNNKATMDVKIYQLVNFLQDGAPIKMSKRAGNYFAASEITEMVGKDAVRFMMLTRKNDMILDFDITLVKEQSKDNPIFYVQYAHARACSLLRNSEFDINTVKPSLSLLNDARELQLIKLLAKWPRVVENAAIMHEVHKIALYLMELAAEFHSLWAIGSKNKSLRFIVEDNNDISIARLALVKAVSLVIASGLTILNIAPADTM